MIDKKSPLSVVKQCKILKFNRSSLYYQCKTQESSENLTLMRMIDRIHTEYPFYGSRKLKCCLERAHGLKMNRKRIQRLMQRMRISALYPKPKMTQRNKEHRIYPYLLSNLAICKPNQVWSTDITYIPMKNGFIYLVAIIDWYSRRVLSYRLSNTLTTEFCIDVLEEAISRFGVPEIFNSDQGSQFTDQKWIAILKSHQIKISMDGKGAWRDNIVMERFWRSLKYEEVYLKAYESMKEAKVAIQKYMKFYNGKRFHQSLENRTPDEIYFKKEVNLVA